jgi:hypothetical protein
VFRNSSFSIVRNIICLILSFINYWSSDFDIVVIHCDCVCDFACCMALSDMWIAFNQRYELCFSWDLTMMICRLRRSHK